MRIIETKVYTIDDHPAPEKCFDWIRANWHDLNQYSLEELILSLKALTEHVGGELDYSISCAPDQGEFISIKGGDKSALDGIEPNDCPFTGCFWDAEAIESYLNDDFNHCLKVLHDETEDVYSRNGLADLCECNEYEFTAEGEAV